MITTLLMAELTRWLGAARIDPAEAATYLRLFLEVTRLDETADPKAVPLAFERFVASADAWARGPVRRVPTTQRLPFQQRTREVDSGLRRGTMRAPVDLNMSDEGALLRELRGVPTIGDALARKIVAPRATLGRFEAKGQLVQLADEPAEWNSGQASLIRRGLP